MPSTHGDPRATPGLRGYVQTIQVSAVFTLPSVMVRVSPVKRGLAPRSSRCCNAVTGLRRRCERGILSSREYIRKFLTARYFRRRRERRRRELDKTPSSRQFMYIYVYVNIERTLFIYLFSFFFFFVETKGLKTLL